MDDYVCSFKNENRVEVCLYNEDAKMQAVGEKINAINEYAYMNGYNWEVFFNYYLRKYEPDVLKEMNTDPEAGMYTAYYPLTPENELRAERFVEIIRSLVEGEEELYRIVEEEGDKIEWD